MSNEIRPMTTSELFTKICELLKERGEYPHILDYELAAERDAVQVLTPDFYLKNELEWGGSEGIYLTLYATFYEGKYDGQTIKIGTFKTLYEDKEALRTMALLLADFMSTCDKYVRSNMDAFMWTGVNVNGLNENGEKVGFGFICKTMEVALERKDELLQKYPKVRVRDNSTHKEELYCA